MPDLLPVAEILPRSLGPYMALMLLGFVVSSLGYMSRSRWLVATGIIMIFLACLLFPLALNIITPPDERPPETNRPHL